MAPAAPLASGTLRYGLPMVILRITHRRGPPFRNNHLARQKSGANDGNPPRADPTPSKQGRSGMLRRGRMRSCVRPTLRGLRTAGPDAIRSLAPKQIYALEWRITLDGFFQAPGLTGSPSRHHRPPHPSAVATADGVPFGFRLRHLGLLPACDRLPHARAKPIRSAPFC